MTTDNQENQKQELEFPIVHDKCPVCGWTKTVTGIMKDEEVAKGKVPEGTRMIALRALTPIAEIQTIMRGLSIVPVLTFEFDVCANPDCGAFYCVGVGRQDMPTGDLQKMLGIAPQPQQRGMFNSPKFPPNPQRRN